MTVMLPFAIVGQVPDTAGIVGPLPVVMTVVNPPPPSFFEPDDEPDDEPLLDPVPPDEPEPEPVPPELVPPLLWAPPELPLPEPPELLDLPPSPSVAPLPLDEVPPPDEPVPDPEFEVPFAAHPTTVDAPRHARTVHRTSAIELTLQSSPANRNGRLGCWPWLLACQVSSCDPGWLVETTLEIAAALRSTTSNGPASRCIVPLVRYLAGPVG